MNILIAEAAKLKNRLRSLAWNQVRHRRLATYLKSDRRPWSEGYWEYREQCLRESIADEELLKRLRARADLPAGYGYRLDARVIEIPWALAHLAERTGKFLDAGSALNYDFVLRSPHLTSKKITITTLAPEANAWWQLGVSYVFGDLRRLDFRDELFDAMACISTIEHIGMDNSMYAEKLDAARGGDTAEFLLALKELKRVLKPGGILCISFPFGRYENHGWFQQFDSQMVDQVISEFDPVQVDETIYRYTPCGWELSERGDCADCQFFDVHTSKYFDPRSTIEYPSDYPAGERALACLELRK